MSYNKKLLYEVLFFILLIFGLDLVSVNYLFFHVFVEFFSVVIMCTLFAVTLNAQKYIENKYLIFVGTAGIFSGCLDLLHTITFDGMNIIPSTRFYANQFWIATRLFEAAVLFFGFWYVNFPKGE